MGLPRTESEKLVAQVLKEISDCLERGETVKLSSFGSFVVRRKGRRIGRNPKTGEEVPTPPRRAIAFRSSPTLQKQIKSAADRTAALQAEQVDAGERAGRHP